MGWDGMGWEEGTYGKKRLFFCEGAGVVVEVLARRGVYDAVEEGLRVGEDTGGFLLDCHFRGTMILLLEN
jgi:hypothetical protein